MSLSESEAKDMFIEIVEEGNCPDLTSKHIMRGYQINKISPNKYHFSFERHPHLFGRQSIGIASSAFATVESTYELDTDLRKIKRVGDILLDMDIDYSTLASEDMDIFMQSIGDELYKLKSIKAVKEFAEQYFGPEELYSSSYELPPDFYEKLKKEWIEIIIETWKNR